MANFRCEEGNRSRSKLMQVASVTRTSRDAKDLKVAAEVKETKPTKRADLETAFRWPVPPWPDLVLRTCSGVRRRIWGTGTDVNPPHRIDLEYSDLMEVRK